MITRICEFCKNQYQTFPSVKKHYCSSKCAGMAKVKEKVEITCKECGKVFYVHQSGKDTSYCSRSCATTFRNKTDTNPCYSRDISGDKNPMYGRGMPGDKNPMFGKRGELCVHWKGGKRKRPDGYIRAIAPDDHPYPSDQKNNAKYVLEHRLVMEKHLGRYLDPIEVVHHIDGNPSNNAIDNLQLFPNSATHLREAHHH